MHSKKGGSRDRRPASAKALWLLAAGVVLVEAALHLMPYGFMTRTVNTRMAEITSLPAPRIQIMGDSVVAGINAMNVAQAANLPAEAVDNYSLPGTSPVFAYYALRRELAAGRVPGRILYAPHPANLEMPMIDRFIGRFGTPEECGDLLTHGVTAPDWLFGAFCRVSVAMRDREEFRVAFTGGDFGFFRTLREPASSIAASRVRMPNVNQPPARSGFSAGNFPPQLRAPFFVDRVNATYIDLFCSLAESRGIRVTWVTVPVARPFKEYAMAGAGIVRYEEFLDGLVARHQNVTLLHPEIEVYPDNWFADPWHMNLYGAQQFSTRLGEGLRNPGTTLEPQNASGGHSGM